VLKYYLWFALLGMKWVVHAPSVCDCNAFNRGTLSTVA